MNLLDVCETQKPLCEDRVNLEMRQLDTFCYSESQLPIICVKEGYSSHHHKKETVSCSFGRFKATNRLNSSTERLY